MKKEKSVNVKIRFLKNFIKRIENFKKGIVYQTEIRFESGLYEDEELDQDISQDGLIKKRDIDYKDLDAVIEDLEFITEDKK